MPGDVVPGKKADRHVVPARALKMIDKTGRILWGSFGEEVEKSLINKGV